MLFFTKNGSIGKMWEVGDLGSQIVRWVIGGQNLWEVGDWVLKPM